MPSNNKTLKAVEALINSLGEKVHRDKTLAEAHASVGDYQSGQFYRGRMEAYDSTRKALQAVETGIKSGWKNV